MIKEQTHRQKELEDDQNFLEEEIMQNKVTTYELKVQLAQAHNECKQQIILNTNAQQDLESMQQASIDQINSFVIAGSQQQPYL